MRFYVENIEKETLDNVAWRKVLYTTPQMQLVVMSIPPGDEIGEESHPQTTQFIRVESGRGTAIIGDKKWEIGDGDAVIIPPATRHNIIAESESEPLKIYTIYSPPEHPIPLSDVKDVALMDLVTNYTPEEIRLLSKYISI